MLTPRQKEVLDFIISYTRSKGFGPTLNEISQALNLGSSSAAHQHVEVLSRRGYLKKIPNQARAISVFDESEDVIEIPIMGRIALGEPIESIDGNESIKIPKMLTDGNGQYYALEALGGSMNEDGILDGDILVIKRITDPNNGDVVVGQIDAWGKEEGATLKRYYNHGNKIELRPKSSNSNFKPKYYLRGEVEIQGKFCGLIRRG